MGLWHTGVPLASSKFSTPKASVRTWSTYASRLRGYLLIVVAHLHNFQHPSRNKNKSDTFRKVLLVEDLTLEDPDVFPFQNRRNSALLRVLFVGCCTSTLPREQLKPQPLSSEFLTQGCHKPLQRKIAFLCNIFKDTTPFDLLLIPCCPIHGAFPMVPLRGCLARQELTQLGSGPLPCQVCFQRAQEGTLLPSLWNQFTAAAAAVPAPRHVRCARRCCRPLPEPQKKQDAQAWDMGFTACLQPVYCVS